MKKKKILKIISSCIVGTLLAIMVYMIGANIYATKNHTISNLFGYSMSYVPTKSMEPTISSESTILIKKSNYEDVKEKDIIVFKNEKNKIVSRRIVEIEDDKYITKGDNNIALDDDMIANNKVYGKVIKTINYYDDVLKFLNT